MSGDDVDDPVSNVPSHFQTILVLCVLSACSAKRAGKVVPEPWANLGLPADGLELVRPETDRDRFSGDYGGCTAEQLLNRVESALGRAGYTQTCKEFAGTVRGYTKERATLLVKVDSIGSVQTLSVGSERGSDRLLFGACFKGYQLGDSDRAK